MEAFPEFMRKPCNAVEGGTHAKVLEGYLYEGIDGTQVVLWQCRKGGKSDLHTHDFDEYAVVIQGTFKGTVGGKPVVMKPGDECFIPAGVPHDGQYSSNYRAIDAFGGKRVQRAEEEPGKRNT